MKKTLLTFVVSLVGMLPLSSKDIPLAVSSSFVVLDMNANQVFCVQPNTDYYIGFGMAGTDKKACACLTSLGNATLLSSSCQDVTIPGMINIVVYTVRYNGGGPMTYTAIPGCCSSGCTSSTSYGTPNSGSIPGC